MNAHRRSSDGIACAIALVLLALLGAACASPAPPPPPNPPRATPDAAAASANGRIEIVCEPEDARVVVDGEARGTVKELAAAGGLELPRGLHRIEIAAEGYRSFRLELNLGDKRESIKVKLARANAKP